MTALTDEDLAVIRKAADDYVLLGHNAVRDLLNTIDSLKRDVASEQMKRSEAERQAEEERRERVDLVAKLSEARIAVPEPLALGQVIKIDRHVLGEFDHVTVSSRKPLVSLADGDEVGIWPANLAEQVCDTELDREGLELEVAALAGVVRHWHDELVKHRTPMTEWTPDDWADSGWTPTEANAIRRALEALEASDGD